MVRYPESRKTDAQSKSFSRNTVPAGPKRKSWWVVVRNCAFDRENAESAARIRARLLQATEDSLKERDTDTAMELIESAMLKMLKDSEDRGLGAPVQSMDHTTNGKDMPTQILIRAADDNGND